ncbi:MAG TPA: gephyrin-like molybdotransferase Glp [Gammaproteobacteria bacterium]|nr:gephyrin-like molybdotransferase Glp [Gammaproteobacteria bacterium]
MSKPVSKSISCQDDFDPESLPAEIALNRIIDALEPVSEAERVPPRKALWRVLAEEIVSNINVPSGTNSAMDGYAVFGNDIPENGTAILELAGSSFAGKPFSGTPQPGQAVRIMTGAVMPPGMDTVIMQEHVSVEGERIRIDDATRPGANVRQAGEDIAAGDPVLGKGHRLTPADLGLIASLGTENVLVSRKLRVAFFSTGDELRSVGEELADGQIYDSNRYTLYGMLERLGVESIDMGVIRDDREALRRGFDDAANTADILITSGGVSVGEADYVKEILEQCGSVDFWKVAMKPGRPLAFGQVRGTWFFGLPGNPVSVMVTFYQFVQPALCYLMGMQKIKPQTLKVTCRSNLRKKPGRIEFQRGILDYNDNGEMVVYKTGAQGSGILRSMSQANCFIVLPMDSGSIEAGMSVDVQPFYGIV